MSVSTSIKQIIANVYCLFCVYKHSSKKNKNFETLLQFVLSGGIILPIPFLEEQFMFNLFATSFYYYYYFFTRKK